MILLTSLILLIPICIVTTGDKIEFECDSAKVKNIKYIKEDSNIFQSLEYISPEKDKITGPLNHNLEVTGGRCFGLIIRGKQNKNEYTDIVELNESPTPKTMPVDFENLHLCQDIAMHRMIQYDKRDPYQYKHGDVSEVDDSMEKSDGQLTCYHRVRLCQMTEKVITISITY